MAICDCREVVVSTFNLDSLSVALVVNLIFGIGYRFSHVVNELYVGAFAKYNSPVRIVITNWCVDVEVVWQFCIDAHFVLH